MESKGKKTHKISTKLKGYLVRAKEMSKGKFCCRSWDGGDQLSEWTLGCLSILEALLPLSGLCQELEELTKDILQDWCLFAT